MGAAGRQQATGLLQFIRISWGLQRLHGGTDSSTVKHGGSRWRSRWNHGGITVESRWDHGGITVGSRWNHGGDHGGITVGSRWNHGRAITLKHGAPAD
eukprot:gene9702-biopygen5812